MGLNLLKKGQKGIIHAIFSRFGLILLLLLAQVLLLFSIFQRFEEFLPHILGGTVLFTLVMVICLLNSRMNPTAKITWLIAIMLLPVFGVLLFLYTRSDIGHRALKKRTHDIIAKTKGLIPQSEEVMEQFSQGNGGAAALARYMARSGCHPVYDGTAVTYFPLGGEVCGIGGLSGIGQAFYFHGIFHRGRRPHVGADSGDPCQKSGRGCGCAHYVRRNV